MFNMNKDNKDLIVDAGCAVLGAVSTVTVIVQAVTILGFVVLKAIEKEL